MLRILIAKAAISLVIATIAMRWVRTPDRELNQFLLFVIAAGIFSIFDCAIVVVVIIGIGYVWRNFGSEIHGALDRARDNLIEVIYRAIEDDAPRTDWRTERYEQLKREHPDYPDQAIEEQLRWEERNPRRLG